MPPPQQLLSSAVSIFTKWLNPTFLVLFVFLIVAVPLSTPSATSQQQSQSSSQFHSSRNKPFSSSNTSNTKPQQQWPHWTVDPSDVCPSAKGWATHPGSFCVTLWNSPYLSNRTELEAREKRAILFYCEMDRILERFDCAQEYSVNVQRGQCKLCRDAYREWACAMVTDTLGDGQLDCDTKLMPCPSCASICHQVMRLCPYLSPDRNQADREGRVSPQVSQYGGHPAFYCPLENDDPSDPAYTSLCFHRSPFSSDLDYVHNVCTNPPLHHHQDHQYVSHQDRNNNDKNSYYPSNQGYVKPNKRINRNTKPSSSSSFSSSTNSAEQAKDYLNYKQKDSKNNNRYYNSDPVINSNINSNNQFSNKVDYNSGEFINYEFRGDDNDVVDDDDDENWAAKILHYTTCCWTYASSVVHFTKSQAYPSYGSDSYFSAVETSTISSSSSLNPIPFVSSNSDRLVTVTSPVTRKPSSESDNRVILNCCDSHGKCKSKDPSEVEDDDIETSPTPFQVDPDSPDNSEHSPVPEPTYKTSHKRSSESVDKTFNFYPIDESPQGDTDSSSSGSYLKPIPKISSQDLQVHTTSKDHELLNSAIQEDDSLPKPTHITPGLDYDEHYLDTEPDGDGGSSSIEDEDVFEPGFDWEKGKSHNDGSSSIGSSKNPGDSQRSYDGNGVETFSSNHHHKQQNKLQEHQDHLKPPEYSESSEMNLEATTTINTYRNNYKIDNNKITNLLLNDDDSKSMRSRSSSSSSVHYQKNAFMAIVIGGDDVDRRHLNLRTASSTFGDEIVDSSNNNNFGSQFTSDSNFGPFEFSEDDNNKENHEEEEEIYYAKTPQDSLKEKVHLVKSVPFPGVKARIHYGFDKSASSSSPSSRSSFNFLNKILSFFYLTLSSTTTCVESTTRPLQSPFTTTFSSSSCSFQKPIITFDSTDCCHLVHLLFLILVMTSNFLPLLLLSTGDDIIQSHHLPKSTATTTSRTFTIHSTSSSRTTTTTTVETKQSVLKGKKCVKCGSDYKKCLINLENLNSQQRHNNILKNERVKKAVVFEIEENGEIKKYYDDIRNTTSQNNGLAALWTFTYYYYYYNSNNCKILKANTPDFKDYSKNNCYNDKGYTSEIFENTRATVDYNKIINYSSSAAHRLLKLKILQIKNEHDPFVTAARKSSTRKLYRNYNDTPRDSCSNLLALLYYKMVKFFIILQLRSISDTIITSMSFQHNKNKNNKNKNKTSILIQTFFHSIIPPNTDVDTWKRSNKTFLLSTIAECVVKWIKFDYNCYYYYYYYIYNCSNYYDEYYLYYYEAYVVDANSLLKELFKHFPINHILFSIKIFLVLVVVANYCELDNIGSVGLPSYKLFSNIINSLVEKCSRKGKNPRKKKAAGYSAELRVLLLLYRITISDSRVTTNCTINHRTNDRKYNYYANNNNNVHYSTSRMITIINKLIQFVVQYDLDYVEGQKRQRVSDLNLKESIMMIMMIANYGQNTEFSTNSYSKCLAFLLLNIKKISISSKNNYKSSRWLSTSSKPCCCSSYPVFSKLNLLLNNSQLFHIKCESCCCCCSNIIVSDNNNNNNNTFYYFNHNYYYSQDFSNISNMTIIMLACQSQLFVSYSSWSTEWSVDKNIDDSCDFRLKNNDINNGKNIRRKSLMMLQQVNPESLELIIILIIIILTINIGQRGHFHGQSSIISTKLGWNLLLNDNNYKNSSIRVVTVRVFNARCSLSGSASLIRSNKLIGRGESKFNTTFSLKNPVLYSSLPSCTPYTPYPQMTKTIVRLRVHRIHSNVVVLYLFNQFKKHLLIYYTTLLPLLTSST